MKNLNKLFFEKTIYMVLISSLTLTSYVQAQVWEHVFGGDELNWAKSIISTSDGGCLTTGFNAASGGIQKVDLRKLSADGDLEWAIEFGDDMGDNDGFDAIETPEGDFVVIYRRLDFDALGVDLSLIHI